LDTNELPCPEAVSCSELLRTATLGRELRWVRETGSTSDDLRREAREGARAGLVLVADAQTRGRGRGDHVWRSLPGEDLTFSVLLRPSAPAHQVPELALVAGVAVARAVEHALPRAQRPGRVGLKWPNDVWLDGRKVAGVLVEAITRGGEVGGVVVGIGLNVGSREFSPELAGRATSLALAEGSTDRAAVLACLLGELEALVGQWEHEGLASVLDELAARDALRGRTVEVGGVEGVAAGIDESGALVVEGPRGRVLVMAGEVAWR
jgi:BirA family biotin operon repressor/biotin-[acetyl-CoA-carboxylase] ligase